MGRCIGGPSQLDREPMKEADDDALRKLYNRFKFGTEAAVVSVPIVYGINTVAKRISEAGKNLKYSNDRLDRLIDKYICLLYTSPSPRDRQKSRMPSSA